MPKGRTAKVPLDTVVTMLKKGHNAKQVAEMVGLSFSRVRGIRASLGLNQPRATKSKQKTDQTYCRIEEDDATTLQRIKAYCRSIGAGNPCIVRQATMSERMEFRIGEVGLGG